MNTAWFTDRLAARRMSQRGLARLMGMDPGAISLTLRGKRKLTLEEAAQMAALLDVSPQEILEHAGVPVRAEHRAKLVGYIDGSSHVILFGEGNHEMIDCPSDMPPQSAAAIQARTAGTDLAHVDGYHMFFTNENVSPASCIGGLAVVAIKSNGLALAHIYKGYRRGTYNLMNWRNQLTTNQELLWAMPVHWIKTVV